MIFYVIKRKVNKIVLAMEMVTVSENYTTQFSLYFLHLPVINGLTVI